MNNVLEQVIQRRDTWRGRQDHVAARLRPANGDFYCRDTLPSGYSTLDAVLRQGGWPLGDTIELLSDGSGLGAMGLLLPAMERLSGQRRWQVFIAPPYTPYAPLLAARGIDTRQVLLVHPRNRADLLWATEQALRSTTCGAVFSWLGNHDYRYGELRKLQLAAGSGDSLAVLFRPRAAACNNAPAPLRLQMREYRRVHILKQRGGQQDVDVDLPPAEDLPHQPQLWELPAWPENRERHQGTALG
jgi:protein ImuA